MPRAGCQQFTTTASTLVHWGRRHAVRSSRTGAGPGPAVPLAAFALLFFFLLPSLGTAAAFSFFSLSSAFFFATLVRLASAALAALAAALGNTSPRSMAASRSFSSARRSSRLCSFCRLATRIDAAVFTELCCHTQEEGVSVQRSPSQAS